MANFNLNKVIIGGRLTSNVELRQTPQGVAVTSFSIAVNRKGKDAQADFINCVAWRQNAEFISRYFKKGSAICVSGSLQTRTWEDNNGVKRHETEIMVEEAMFVDSKTESATDEPVFQTPNAPKFEEVANDDDLPF